MASSNVLKTHPNQGLFAKKSMGKTTISENEVRNGRKSKSRQKGLSSAQGRKYQWFFGLNNTK